MPPARSIVLLPDTVYRTKDFAVFGQNPSRLVHRLVEQGRIEPLGHCSIKIDMPRFPVL